MANVTVIPATRSLHSKLLINTRARRRVEPNLLFVETYYDLQI